MTRRLQRLADQYRQRTGVDVTTVEGAGAAGGLAGGLVAIGAQLVPGFEAVAEAIGLEAAFDGAALVVTGEGKVDASSLDGKVVGGVLAWAAELGVPHVGVIAGQVTDDARDRARTAQPTRACSRSPTACGRPARPTSEPRCSSRKRRWRPPAPSCPPIRREYGTAEGPQSRRFDQGCSSR